MFFFVFSSGSYFTKGEEAKDSRGGMNGQRLFIFSQILFAKLVIITELSLYLHQN